MLFDRDTTNCSIARTLEVVGEKWTLLILREAWCGASRFSDFERILGCPRNLLAERLRKLVEHGILSTEPYQETGSRSRLRYVITPKGKVASRFFKLFSHAPSTVMPAPFGVRRSERISMRALPEM